MPSFDAALRECLADGVVSCGTALRRTMPGQGRTGSPSTADGPQAVWWFSTGTTAYSNVHLCVSLRNAQPGDQLAVELWAQECATGGGIRLANLTVDAIDENPTLQRHLVVVGGCLSTGWGIRAQQLVGDPRELCFSVLLSNCCQGSGVIWLGEGVTNTP